MGDYLTTGTEKRDRHELYRERRICRIQVAGEFFMSLLTDGVHADETYEVHGGLPADTQIMAVIVGDDHVLTLFIVSEEFEPIDEHATPPQFDILMSKVRKPCVLKVPKGTLAALVENGT